MQCVSSSMDCVMPKLISCCRLWFVRLKRPLRSISSMPQVWPRCPAVCDSPADTLRSPWTTAAKKLVEKEDLDHLLYQLVETKDKLSNSMLSTIQNVIRNRIQAEIYCDEWPQFKAIAARITSPTVVDVVLYTTCQESALGLLYDKRILTRGGSHISGGVIFAEMEDSLAEYLRSNMKSCDGKSLLSFDVETKSRILQYPRDARRIPQNPSCPPGYVIDSLRPEHATYISKFWRFNDYTSNAPHKFEHMIRTLPSSAAFFNPEGTRHVLPYPVGWVASFPHGHMSPFMILDDHEKEYLFKPLAQDLCRKLLIAGHLPELASDDTTAISAAKKCGFVQISNGKRLVYHPSN